MRVIQKARPAGTRVVALGTFDGVHRGHQALLRTAGMYARENGILLRVCTFNRHPLRVIRPEIAPPLLTTIAEKARRLQKAGVDEMELMLFDHRMAETEPADFLKQLRSAVKLRAVVAGWNYSFGRNGRGNAVLLQEDGKKYGYDVLIEPPAVLEDGTVISSTQVRRCLQDGQPEKAEELLGYAYTLSGIVGQGKHQGRLLGFPTANIEPFPEKMLPAFGVYTCWLEEKNGTYPAVVNIGLQPTLPSGRITVEAHVLNDSPQLYGQRVRLTLGSMLRKEQKFDSPEQLKQRIEKDREDALRWFGMA